MEQSALFEACNDTELYQLARRAGLTVLPNLPREQLVKCLLGEESPPPVRHEIDEWRMALMGFVLDYWRVIESQLTCPAKSGDPRACFGCVDAQVVSCVTRSGAHLPLIQVHKKPIPQATTQENPMTAQALSIENAPRSVEELGKHGVYQLRLLADKLGAFKDAAAREAWHTMSKEDKLSEIARLLHVHDQQNGGPPAAAAAPVLTPVAPPAVPTTTVAAVSQAALANAQQAAAPTPGKRQPKQANGAAATAAPAPAAAAAPAPAPQVIAGIDEETRKLLHTFINTQNAEINALKARVTALEQQTAQQKQLLDVSFTLLLTLAENTLGANRSEILQTVIDDQAEVCSLIAQFVGKAA